jgi:endonuclease-8
MPEGDTLARIATALRPHLIGRTVAAARARAPGPQVGRVVGQPIVEVEAVGKHLLIKFGNGLQLRTHLGMHGSWHRYRPGEAWRRAPSRAVLVLEVPGTVAVCFDAPGVDLFEARAEPLHPIVGRLGPDLTAPDFDSAEAIRRLRGAERSEMGIGEALLDQRAVAGVGNVFKSEVLFIERVDPFAPVKDLSDAQLQGIVSTARRFLQSNADPEASASRTTTRDPITGKSLAPSRLWVYGRAGRPCHRDGTLILSAPQGAELPRTTYWCPTCQKPPR